MNFFKEIFSTLHSLLLSSSFFCFPPLFSFPPSVSARGWVYVSLHLYRTKSPPWGGALESREAYGGGLWSLEEQCKNVGFPRVSDGRTTAPVEGRLRARGGCAARDVSGVVGTGSRGSHPPGGPPSGTRRTSDPAPGACPGA